VILASTPYHRTVLVIIADLFAGMGSHPWEMM
jgi:hypothetical protein